jgi:hypothetical protein
MSKTHWKKLINPDYLGAYSLDNGQGGYVTIVATIGSAKVENVTGPDGKKEDCVVMRFKESRIGNIDMKPMIVNTTNMKTLEKLFKTPYIEDWAGRKIEIGVESVKAFGDVVDALRIKKRLPSAPPADTGPVKCADTGKEITATEKMSAAQIVAVTQKRYGRPLCAERWMELAEQEKQAAETTASDAPPENVDAPESLPDKLEGVKFE